MKDPMTSAAPDTALPAAFRREAVSFYALLPALALTAGIAASLLSRAHWNQFILPLEVFADLFIAFFAFRQTSAGARWWRIAAVSLLAGDSFYLAGHAAANFPAWAFMTQEAFYTLGHTMTAVYLFSNLPPARELEAVEKALLAVLVLAGIYISVQYLLIPYFSSGNHATPFFYTNAVLNRLAETAVLPLAVLLGMKARSRYWLYLTHGIALLSITSLALGYNTATSANMGSVPFQEYGWLCGLLLILAAQAYRASGGEPFARWKSARVRMGWLVLSSNMALLLLLYLIQTLTSKDAFQLTSILFIFFGLWLAANLIAFRISEDIYLLLENVTSGGGAEVKSAFRVAIYEAELFAEKLKAAYETIRSQARLSALASLAAQVAHDIRSPLAALDSVLKDVSELPEEKRRLIGAATGRIRGIAADLLERNRRDASAAPAAGPREPLALRGLIEAVITEKRLQYGGLSGVAIEAGFGNDASGLSARVEPVAFGRALSNLINNAVEAMERGGAVTVSLARRGNCAEVAVRDNGKGIPPEVLGRLGRRGETYGKAGGSGLGLHHAREAAESWNGSLTISSHPGKGTEVLLLLPLFDPSGGG